MICTKQSFKWKGSVASYVSYPISKPSLLTGTKLTQIWCFDYGELSNSSWFYLTTGFVFGYVHCTHDCASGITEGKFAVKQTPQCFNGVGADMALEQIIVFLVYFFLFLLSCQYQCKWLPGDSSPKWPIMCRVGRKPLLTHSSSTKIGWVHLYLKIALPASMIHLLWHHGMKSMKYSSQICCLNVCIQFGSLSPWSTRPLVGQKGSTLRNVETTDQHLCYWLVLCMTYRALWCLCRNRNRTYPYLLEVGFSISSTRAGDFFSFSGVLSSNKKSILEAPSEVCWTKFITLWMYRPHFEVLGEGCEPTILGKRRP